MELRTLRYFLAVAEHGSVTAAADVVHVTQPSLSRQLRGFERDLGLTLFDRRDNRLVLNSAGRQFLPVARDLVARAEMAAKAAATIRAGRLDTLTISSPGTTLTDVIAPFLATWGPDDPMPAVWEELPPIVYRSLDRGADLAIGADPPPGHLASLPIAVLPVWAYVRADHPWAARDRIPLRELVTADLLVLGQEQHSRTAFDHAVAGMALPSVTEFGTPEVAQAVAAAGRGVAIVSDDPRFGLVPLPVAHGSRRLSIRLYAAWAADHHARDTLADVARRLSAFCVQRYGRRAAP